MQLERTCREARRLLSQYQSAVVSVAQGRSSALLSSAYTNRPPWERLGFHAQRLARHDLV